MAFEEWWLETRPINGQMQYCKAAWDAAIKAEREACAKICRTLADECDISTYKDAAVMMEAYEFAEHEIRERSNVK